MIISSFSSSDDVEVIDLWNSTLKCDTVDENNFYKRVICDENFNPELFLLAKEDEQLLGFIYGIAVSGQEKAWISTMAVHSDKQRRGIGNALLRCLEEKFLKHGVKQITLGANPDNFFFPGVDMNAYDSGVKFFTSGGYSEFGTCVSMDMSLRDYQVKSRYLEKKSNLEANGYTFKFFSWQDSIALFDFMNEHFPHWLSVARTCLSQNQPKNTLIIAKNPKQEVVGFVLRGIDGTSERFGPFGVSPTEQGTGVGGVLFHEMMQSMVKNRIFYTYFLWTGGRNIDIYGKWGMKVYREYFMMKKELN